MKKYRYIKVAIFGFSMAFIAVASSILSAETLHVQRGDINAAINVPIDGTVVVESSVGFYEVTIANPATADISVMTDRLVAISGSKSGRTTITVLDQHYHITNVEILVGPNMPEFDETNPVKIPNSLPPEPISVFEGEASDTLSLLSNGAVTVGSDVPFDDIKIDNPNIVAAVRIIESQIYLLGKGLGRTTLTLLRNDDRPATIIQLRVLPNTDAL